MLDDLGEGIFGSVKLGVEKKTKERVAIKIIKKKKAKPSDIELVRTEIDIMKLCHHPNVVRLLDHFENAEYIFIVMEYIRGGRLTDYMKEKKFNFTEKRVAELIYEIALLRSAKSESPYSETTIHWCSPFPGFSRNGIREFLI